MTIKKLLSWAAKELKNLDNSLLEAEVLLAELLKKDRVFLKTHPQKRLSFTQIVKFYCWIKKRKKRVPVAQIVGYKNWANFKVFVNKNVLIPRDETEILCEKIIAKPRKRAPQTILDVGTGSGNIAVFCAKHFSEAKITALDVSKKALKIAQKNAEFHKITNTHFRFSDLLEEIPKNAKFDLIIANLPYVPTGLKVSPEVKNEPQNAVFSSEDGLYHLRKFASQIKSKNIQFEELWLEFLPTQKKEIAKIFSPWKVKFIKDAGGEIFFAKITP